jgi:hypothetical protein
MDKPVHQSLRTTIGTRDLMTQPATAQPRTHMDDLAAGRAIIHAPNPQQPTATIPNAQTQLTGGSRLRPRVFLGEMDVGQTPAT